MHTNDVWNQTIDKISKKSNNKQYDAAESQRQTSRRGRKASPMPRRRALEATEL